jgi:acetyltransferase-like isoleucine patch superfamily enzyme
MTMNEVRANARRALVAVSARIRYPSLFRARIYGDPRRLDVHRTAVVNNATFNLSSGTVTMRPWAFFGHNVTVLTGTHDVTKFGRDRHLSVPDGGRDVVIDEGAWITSNATIVGPCRIGAHAVVGVGAVVIEDVPPYTVVAGIPARVVSEIPHPSIEADTDPPTPRATTSDANRILEAPFSRD